MSQPFIGEIRMFAGNFPPRGWKFCEGQELPISENDALFSLIGTTYGGNGGKDEEVPKPRHS
jgi:microcystin-dependent protein